MSIFDLIQNNSTNSMGWLHVLSYTVGLFKALQILLNFKLTLLALKNEDIIFINNDY